MGIQKIGLGMRGIWVKIWGMQGMKWECGESGWKCGESRWECGEQGSGNLGNQGRNVRNRVEKVRGIFRNLPKI